MLLRGVALPINLADQQCAGEQDETAISFTNNDAILFQGRVPFPHTDPPQSFVITKIISSLETTRLVSGLQRKKACNFSSIYIYICIHDNTRDKICVGLDQKD